MTIAMGPKYLSIYLLIHTVYPNALPLHATQNSLTASFAFLPPVSTSTCPTNLIRSARSTAPNARSVKTPESSFTASHTMNEFVVTIRKNSALRLAVQHGSSKKESGFEEADSYQIEDAIS